IPIADDQRIIINVMPGMGGEASGYRIGGDEFPVDPSGLAALTQRLAAAYRINPAVNVNVRADRNTHFEHVEPVMRAVSAAARASGQPIAAARVNLVVVKER